LDRFHQIRNNRHPPEIRGSKIYLYPWMQAKLPRKFSKETIPKIKKIAISPLPNSADYNTFNKKDDLKISGIKSGFKIQTFTDGELTFDFKKLIAKKEKRNHLHAHQYKIVEYNKEKIVLEQTYGNFDNGYDDKTCNKKCRKLFKKMAKKNGYNDIFLKMTYSINNGNLNKEYYPYTTKVFSKNRNLLEKSQDIITKPFSVAKDVLTNAKDKLVNRDISVSSFVDKYDDEIVLVFWAALTYVALDNADSISEIFKQTKPSASSISSVSPKSSLKRYVFPRGGVKYVPDSKAMRLLMKSKGAVGF